MDGIWLVSYLSLWIVTLFQAGILLVLVRQIGLLHLRLQPSGARTTDVGPQIGATLPEVQADDVMGHPVSIIGRDRARMLLFVSPQCPACEELLPAVKTIARSERARLDVVLLTAVEDHEANQAYVGRHKLNGLSLVASQHLAQMYGVFGTPYALVVDKAGVVRAKGIVNHIEHLESLVEALVRGQATVTEFLTLERGRAGHAS